MKFSESWLREWVSPAINTEDLMAQVTMAGLEVDGVELAAPAFTGVVVGEIMAIEQHPDADKLHVCLVAGNGDELTQVVCGAPNARVGIKIPFATVGAKLPGDFKIKKAKLRGVESFGMLCAEEELGVSDASDGLWELAVDAPVGANIRDYLQFDDQIIEIDLTPNRGDCLSVRGVAREVGVLNQEDVTEVSIEAVAATIDDVISVDLQAPKACPQYVGRVIRNVDISRPSPKWMQEKLRRSGLRSIDAIVDVTNYVLMELGQPLHAFDLNTLEGGVAVRMAEQDEELTLLDGSELKLNSDTLVIADQNRALAMAGIMGGKSSAVSSTTTDLFLESAYFDPIAIAGRARNYGMHTDASHRYERGVDPELQAVAIERATALLLASVGGQAGPLVHAQIEAEMPLRAKVELRKTRLKQQLALDLDDAVVEEMLTRLGLELVLSTDDSWTFKAPSWRFDIEIEADLIEEIARIYGYNRLPTATPLMPLPIEVEEEAKVGLPALRQQLIARGYQEAITYSFVDPAIQKLIDPNIEPVALANPISADMSVMRTSLFAGLLTTLSHNLNRQQSRVRLFETGLRFLPVDGAFQQAKMIAGLISGRLFNEGWTHDKNAVDFFDLKGDVEALLSLTGEPEVFSFQRSEHSALHPGQSADIYRAGNKVGTLGKLHPSLQKKLGLGDVYLFELQLSEVIGARLPTFAEVSKFPEVRRDLALVIDTDTLVSDLLATINSCAGSNLVNLKVFDIYQGKGIENNRKSVAVGLIFQTISRTLEEQEVNESINKVVRTLEQQYGATLRG